MVDEAPQGGVGLLIEAVAGVNQPGWRPLALETPPWAYERGQVPRRGGQGHLKIARVRVHRRKVARAVEHLGDRLGRGLFQTDSAMTRETIIANWSGMVSNR